MMKNLSFIDQGMTDESNILIAENTNILILFTHNFRHLKIELNHKLQEMSTTVLKLLE